MKKLLSVNFAKSLKIIILGFVTFLSLHCNEERNSTDIPVINVEKGLQQGGIIKLSDLCLSVEYIPLQTDSNSIIGSRPLLNLLDSSFYIDNITPNVPVISLINVPGVSLTNEPVVSPTNEPLKRVVI